MTPAEVRSTEAKIRFLDLRAEELQRRLAALEERVSGQPLAFLPWTERVRIQFAKVPFDPEERMRAVEEETALLERWLATILKKMPQGPIV
jgi:PAS domain-containing protein